MKTVLVLLALLATLAVAILSDAQIEADFQDFIQKYNKHYDTPEEHQMRLQNYKASLERVKSKNARSRGNVRFGITKFSDMTPQEFKETMLMSKELNNKRDQVGVIEPKNVQIPNAYDWRGKGAVTPVKNQEQCGSCWAFSVTENIESVWILAGKGSNSSVDLAPQQIVDCDNSDLGCNGGDPPTAYEYVISAGGMESESDYPYVAQDESCRFKKNEVVAKISNYKYACNAYDEKTLQNNLVSWSPLSICVDAANWQDYSSGVMGPWECAWVVQLDHCVQLVGYNSQASTPYYIVRNSWGTDWGIDGYIYLEMGHDTCGLTQEATTAVV